MKKLLLLLFPLLLVGCADQKPEGSKKTIHYIEKEDFLENALSEYSLNNISVKHKIISWDKTTYINNYDSLIIDTIYHYKSQENLIEVYKSVDKDFLISFKISDPVFCLPNNIKVGISKAMFIESLKIQEPINDSISIGDMERNTYFTFHFNDNKLIYIDFKSYLD